MPTPDFAPEQALEEAEPGSPGESAVVLGFPFAGMKEPGCCLVPLDLGEDGEIS